MLCCCFSGAPVCDFYSRNSCILETVFVDIDLTFELAMKDSPSQQQSMKI